jgi:membrane fusion protein (multidrug efflux system)
MSATIPDKPVHYNEKEEKRKSLKRRKKRNIVINTICILLIIGGFVWMSRFFWRYSRYEITNDALIDEYIVPVNVRISGYIKSVRFTEHQKVKAGDTLVILDNREFQIKVMDAEAALAESNAAAAAVSSGINTSVSNIAVSDANIVEAQTRLWKAEQDYNRYKNLLDEESVSRQQYEQAKTEYEALKARYNALLKQGESVKSASSEVSKRAGSAEANILRRKADLEMARLNLSYTVITAPYDGYMGRRSIEEGQFVAAGQTLTNIVNDVRKWVTANYKETQIANIYIGQEVNIKVDAIDDKLFKGTVTAISEATGSKYSLVPTDNSAGNFVKIQQRIPVRIDFTDLSPEDAQRLRAGMMAVTEAKIKK